MLKINYSVEQQDEVFCSFTVMIRECRAFRVKASNMLKRAVLTGLLLGLNENCVVEVSRRGGGGVRL
jgi:hypothetical protein